MNKYQTKLIALDPYLLKVYITLTFLANEKNQVLISLNHLKKMTGLSKDRVIKSINELIQIKYLRKYKTTNFINIYEVLV